MSDINIVQGPAPFEAKFTGTYEDTGYRPNPGALFKITNKFDKPVSISNATLYAYDKSGNQVELSLYDGSKSRYAQDSKQGLLELAPGQTKELVHSVHEGMLPADVDALQPGRRRTAAGSCASSTRTRSRIAPKTAGSSRRNS
jgi:hypothetical protein